MIACQGSAIVMLPIALEGTCMVNSAVVADCILGKVMDDHIVSSLLNSIVSLTKPALAGLSSKVLAG